MGKNERVIYQTTYESADFGDITLACDGESLVGLWLVGQKYYSGTVAGEMVPRDDFPVFAQAKDWLDRYFAGGRPLPAELPLAPIGGDFRQCVWRILAEIPYGKVRTYGSIAAQVALETGRAKMSAQAVGGAVGHNTISIIIPCHRVVGASGSLTGYAGGIAKKVKLLKHEGVDMTGFFIPKRGTAL